MQIVIKKYLAFGNIILSYPDQCLKLLHGPLSAKVGQMILIRLWFDGFYERKKT